MDDEDLDLMEENTGVKIRRPEVKAPYICRNDLIYTPSKPSELMLNNLYILSFLEIQTPEEAQTGGQ